MENPAQVSTSAVSDSSDKMLRIALSVAIVFVSLFLIIIGFLFLSQNYGGKSQALTKNSISGIINFNGVALEGATISIGERKVGDSQFTIIQSGIVPVDGVTWSWNGSQAGVAYEFQAYLKQDNKTITQSDTLVVTAPADSEILTINAKTQTSPEKIQEHTSISGQMDINGYIPQGSTVTIYTRKNGDSQFVPGVSGISAIDGVSWSLNNLRPGISYDVQAFLISNGATISQSTIQTITAPAYNETIKINSSAISPASSFTSISGTINYNGSIPASSSISISTRKSGTSQFTTVVSNIPVADGQSWNWNQAQQGVVYDIQATLLVNGNVATQSQIITVAVPAVNEKLTLNAQVQPSQPGSGSMTNNCVGQNLSGQWQVSFTYNNNAIIQNAQAFHIIVGTSGSSNNLVDVTTNPTNPKQSQTYTSGNIFSTGQTYYASWAYSTCTSCGTYSQFSAPLQFYCNPQPTSTPTNPPTNTPTPTTSPTPSPSFTPTPTLAPTFTPTPTVCLPDSTVCAVSTDCCSGMCADDGSGTGTKRCIPKN